MTRLKNYACLMRLHKPVGIFLLLWPTLWALWLAGEGKPNYFIVMIFVAGVILMRSAGCVINDIADRKVDGLVQRTRDRPLASGSVSVKEAFILFVVLITSAFLLVLNLNVYTILLAFVGALLAAGYPFLKRVTHLPQVGLGIAFAWGVPMAFSAELNQVPLKAWVLFSAAAIWPVIYDTYYAMVDRVDDVKVGIRSTAILFGQLDRLIIGMLQILFLLILGLVGWLLDLKWFYFASLLIGGVLFGYQQWLTRDRDSVMCFRAFLNNQWVGLVVFVGIFLSTQYT